MGGGFEFVIVNDPNQSRQNEKVKNHLRQRQSALRRTKLKELRLASVALKSNSIVANGLLAFRRKDASEDTSESSGDEFREPSSSALAQSPATPTATPPAAARSPGLRSDRVACIAIIPRAAEGPLSERPRKDGPAPAPAPETRVRVAHPRSLLGAARSDPFQSYPIPGDREVDELFDFYARDLGPRIFQYTSNTNHDLFRSHASISLSDPAAFHSLLLLAAINRDRLAGRSLPGLRALFHRVEAIRLINERLDSQDPGVRLSEGTIYTTIRLEVLEKQWNAVGEDEIHMPGLQQLIIQKGGIQALSSQHPALEVLLYATSVVMPRMLHAGSPTLYCAAHAPLSPQQEDSALAGGLIAFLTTVAAKAEFNAPLFARLQFALGRTRGIFELLMPQSWSSEVGLPPTIFNLVGDRLRMSIAFYLHWALLGLMDRGGLVDFEDHLQWLMRHEWIWRKSLRMLHYLLVKDEDSSRLADPAAAWQVLRLGSATCFLSRTTCEVVQRYLLDLLSGNQEAHLDIDLVKLELANYV